jgi:hypothetical protein
MEIDVNIIEEKLGEKQEEQKKQEKQEEQKE